MSERVVLLDSQSAADCRRLLDPFFGSQGQTARSCVIRKVPEEEPRARTDSEGYFLLQRARGGTKEPPPSIVATRTPRSRPHRLLLLLNNLLDELVLHLLRRERHRGRQVERGQERGSDLARILDEDGAAGVEIVSARVDIETSM